MSSFLQSADALPRTIPAPRISPVAAPPVSAVVAMTLAGLCYAPRRRIAEHLATPALATGGDWRVVWGPVETVANLLYVAHSPAANAYAVAIRGTVPTPGPAQLLNVYQDLHVAQAVEWTHGDAPGAVIARGTADGLRALLSCASGGAKLEAFLERATADAPDAAVVVTGHSLGGCLATVLAPYLRHRLPHVHVAPVTFAAPTAGNAAFAAHFDALFPGAPRYHNRLDLVPMAWAGLDGVGGLFPPPGPRCPSAFRQTVRIVCGWLARAGLDYAHPGVGIELAGVPERRFTRTDRVAAFTRELVRQHHPDSYLALLGAPGLPFELVQLPVRLRIPRIAPPSAKSPA
ncbi:lipase family protein [Longimicrobium sp.]|uniref:lipase family protein n=1 Tax=Longimicrobium sp. TaxID=2029185 RepID=UPI002E36B77E|nr:lipase family protein [Longimicrobium sp.]HEX6038768.1 lipase family protein [Longimicrobium sp.]